jgi:hypothetical protein
MATRYFKLSDDVYWPGRWELGAPLDGRGQKVWTWLFRRGEPAVVEGPIRIPLSLPGKSLDFSVAGAAVPIIHEKVAAIFTELTPNDVQLIPVRIDSQADEYFILNVLRVVRCIDDAACEEVQYWTPEDGQPELVGEYRVVAGMRIDPTRVSDAKVFRPWGWPVVLIVSEYIRAALARMGVSGAKFQDVTLG